MWWDFNWFINRECLKIKFCKFGREWKVLYFIHLKYLHLEKLLKSSFHLLIVITIRFVCYGLQIKRVFWKQILLLWFLIYFMYGFYFQYHRGPYSCFPLIQMVQIFRVLEFLEVLAAPDTGKIGNKFWTHSLHKSCPQTNSLLENCSKLFLALLSVVVN